MSRADWLAHLFQLLKDVVEPPEAESGLELRDGGQRVQELFSRGQGDVGLGSLGLRQHRPLVVRRHEVGEKFLQEECRQCLE